MEFPDLKSFNMESAMTALGTALIGASGQDLAKMAGAIPQAMKGDFAGAVQSLVPRAIRDILSASKMATKGITNTKGQTLLPPSALSDWDIAAKALGFEPSAVSEFYEGRAAVTQARAEINDQHAALLRKLVSASNPENVIQQISEFNQAHPQEALTTRAD